MKRIKSTNQPPKKKQKIHPSAASSHIQKYPSVIPIDDSQRKRFGALSKRKILPNKYVDLPSLSLLKITQELQTKLDTVGWSDLMHMDEPSYKTLTCEFLSSFRVVDDTTLSFRIANEQHDLTRAALADMFGWKLVEQDELSNNYATPFWLKITGLPAGTKYIPRTASSSAIRSYCLRYFARLMSFTIYGRKESNNKIQKGELVLLNHFDAGIPMDWTSLLITRFLYQAEKKEGALVMGGFVTRIAERLGVFDHHKTSLKEVDGWSTTIDMDYLTGMHMLQPDPLDPRVKGLTRVPLSDRRPVHVGAQVSDLNFH